MSMLYSDDKRDFLICSNREERLRFNMEDITQDNGYKERLHNFGVLHPYSLLIYIICGITLGMSIALIALSSVYSHNLLVPAGYLRIVWFLKKQNQKMVETLGVQKHRQRNIVSIGCITKYYDDISGFIFSFQSACLGSGPDWRPPGINIFQIKLSAGDGLQSRDPGRTGSSGLSLRSQGNPRVGLQEDHCTNLSAK